MARCTAERANHCVINQLVSVTEATVTSSLTLLASDSSLCFVVTHNEHHKHTQPATNDDLPDIQV